MTIQLLENIDLLKNCKMSKLKAINNTIKNKQETITNIIQLANAQNIMIICPFDIDRCTNKLAMMTSLKENQKLRKSKNKGEIYFLEF